MAQLLSHWLPSRHTPCSSCWRQLGFPGRLLSAKRLQYHGMRKTTPSINWHFRHSCFSQLATPSTDAPVKESSHAESIHPARQIQLPNNFDPAGMEAQRYSWWESNGYFAPKAEGAIGTPFVLSMPPPNVTGRLHMGHAVFVTLQDVMVRFNRMKGRETLWLPGTDHAGIATQLVVEKLLAAEGTTRLELGREAFQERVWAWKAEYGGFITRQLRAMGASCDWSREHFTLDPQLSDAVGEAFVRLHAKGLIYRGSYLVNWSPSLQTAVSDLEVEYSEEPGTMYYFRYPIADSEEFLPVATTRPETILGDSAVAVHPEDPRYAHLVGKDCVVPTTGRRIPVIADEYVDREFGTGALKITPGHDPNDYEIGLRRGLEMINIMDNTGTLNAAAGKYSGLDRAVARTQLWQDLEAQGLAIRTEPYTLRVPRSQRGGEIIEPMVREQWFVKMDGLAKAATQAVERGDITIVPERFNKIYFQWLDNIRDWCISRQLWWGHRIPVWYLFDSEAEAEASPDGRSGRYVVARNTAEAATAAAAQEGYVAGQSVLRQETDVLDTWFSSGLWPFSTLGWPDESAPDFQRFYPTTVMETGHDILFFWVARMIMMGIEFTGKVPFSTVYLHGLVRDGQGRKMSKSLGNVIDPLDVAKEFGCDALRFTLATGTTPGQDLNLNMERVTAYRNFTNKLWNAGKFVGMNLSEVSDAEWSSLADADLSTSEALQGLPLTERWLLSALHQAVDRSTAAHERFDFGEAGRCLYSFMWDDFADWYIEAAKPRLYGGSPEGAAATRAVLVYSFNTILKLLHPFMPYVTEELWQALPHSGPSLMTARWPAAGAAVDGAAISHFEALRSAVTSVRNARAEYGVELGRRIPGTLHVTSPELRSALAGEADRICQLAKLDPEGFSVAGPVEGAVQGGQIALVVGDGVEIVLPLAGLFDPEKELARLAKQKGKLEKDLEGLVNRLSNAKFMAKARPEVVAEVQAQRSEAEEKLAAICQKETQMAQLAAATAA